MREWARNGWIASALLALVAGGAAMSQVTGSSAGTAGPMANDSKTPAAGLDSAKAKASAAVAGPAAANAAVAGGCVPAVSANGYASIEGFARQNAKGNWEDIAQINYGGNYGLYSNAVNKSETCSRSGGWVGKWTCTFTAEPCMVGGTSTNTSGPACYPSISVTGAEALLQIPGAVANARNQWQHDAGQAHGPEYKAWNTAQDATMFCDHNGRKGPYRRWHCTATGKPCR